MTARRGLEWSDGALGALLSADEDLSWQSRALCTQTDPEIFFPEVGISAWNARKICRGCEVREECLELALAQDEEPEGIWAGLTERERRSIRRDRAVPLPPVVTASEKYCPGCDTTKAGGEFWKNRSKADGLASHCIACSETAPSRRAAA